MVALRTPERVLSLGLHDQDFLWALGVQPIAVHEWEGGYPYAVGPWTDGYGTTEPAVLKEWEINLEWVAAQTPDLIVVTYHDVDQAMYDKLSAIAPVVAPPADYRVWESPSTGIRTPTRSLAQVGERPAVVDDVHDLAASLPHVKLTHGPKGNPIYQVGGKSFVFFRTPRPDAFDPDTGERYEDVIMIWVGSPGDKLALVDDPDSPFFTTSHFDGHPSVLVRAARLGEVSYAELTEIIQDAWLAQASDRRAQQWLNSHPSTQVTG